MVAGLDTVSRTRNAGRYYGNGRHWETPPEVFDPLHAEFNFTLDLCCSVSTAKCSQYFTEEDDGLSKSWVGHRVFMNPPYGREIYAWTRKARAEVASGCQLVVGLVPASVDLAWWHEDVLGHAEIRYMRKRPKFLHEGKWVQGFFASVVLVWRAPEW